MANEYDDLFPGTEVAPEQPAQPAQPADTMDQFLAGLDAEQMPTENYVRITSSANGGVVDVPIDPEHTVNGLPGYTLREVLDLGNLTWNAATQFWAGETELNMDAILATGAQVTAVGVVKGG